MAEFYGNSVGTGTVAHTLPPVVEHHSVQRPLQARGFEPEAVVGGENGYCTAFAAINGIVPKTSWGTWKEKFQEFPSIKPSL